jgi:quercetin dioxygenase-like cupin family protein
MQYSTMVESPVSFLVEDYAPGYTIDFRRPAASTDVGRARETFDWRQFSEQESDRELVERLGAQLVALGVTEHGADLDASLRAFTRELELDRQLSVCLRRLGVGRQPSGRVEKLRALLERTHCARRPPHFPVRLYCHVPGGTTELEAGSTHYGYVLDGECIVQDGGRQVTVTPNTFFCIAGAARIQGSGRVEVTTRFEYLGITQYGGEVEKWGRLEYIDGCTDTVLLHPPRRGDPCYNALYFPEFTEQTQHVHPSLRCGLVIDGCGVCKTPYGEHALARGKLFFLPPETYHSFHTRENGTGGRAALTVIAFHPDSDFGPTDDDHPMINRTYFKFLHRLASAEKEQSTANKRRERPLEIRRREPALPAPALGARR